MRFPHLIIKFATGRTAPDSRLPTPDCRLPTADCRLPQTGV
ncbi:hypothetical protein [Moorena producens]